MNPLAYIPRPRHLRRARHGFLCAVCMSASPTFRGMWLHKVRSRHPYIGDGVKRWYSSSTFTWINPDHFP